MFARSRDRMRQDSSSRIIALRFGRKTARTYIPSVMLKCLTVNITKLINKINKMDLLKYKILKYKIVENVSLVCSQLRQWRT